MTIRRPRRPAGDSWPSQLHAVSLFPYMASSLV